jgi:hypothetical protein
MQDKWNIHLPGESSISPEVLGQCIVNMAKDSVGNEIQFFHDFMSIECFKQCIEEMRSDFQGITIAMVIIFEDRLKTKLTINLKHDHDVLYTILHQCSKKYLSEVNLPSPPRHAIIVCFHLDSY